MEALIYWQMKLFNGLSLYSVVFNSGEKIATLLYWYKVTNYIKILSLAFEYGYWNNT
jgi:hypothetical protein